MIVLGSYACLALAITIVLYLVATVGDPRPNMVEAFHRAKRRAEAPLSPYVFCERTNRWRDRETKKFVKASVATA